MSLMSKFFNNTKKPEGFLGKVMVNGMNSGGHSTLAEWGFGFVDISRNDTALDCGCSCSASMLCSHFLNALEQGKLKRILFVATGALLSPLTVKQKESVPSIAHAVVLEGK